MATRANPFLPGPVYSRPTPDSTILTARPSVRFLSQAVQPPSNLYVELADVLRISAASSQPNEAVTVNYRLLLPSGEVVEGQSTLAVSSNRAINIHDEPLAEGFLLSCSCKAAAATTRGQTFVRIFLTNPRLGTGQPSYMLMADYVTTAMAPAHPNGRVLAPSEGPGNIVTLNTVSTPAGQDWSFTTPSNARWHVLCVFANFDTDATAGSRSYRFQAFSGGFQIWEFFMSTQQLASLQQRSNIAGGVAIAGVSVPPINTSGIPLPITLPILAGGQLGSLTTFVGAADRWTFVSVQLEEWLDNV